MTHPSSSPGDRKTTEKWTLTPRRVLFASNALFLLFGAALVAGCANSRGVQPAQNAAPTQTTKPMETAASDLVDHAGDSAVTAVEVPADAPMDGVPFQNDWIYDRIGRFRRTGGGTGQLNGRRYDIVEVETPMGGHYKFYFDITENWKRWPTPKQ